MKKIYRIALFILLFIFLTTFNPLESNLTLKNKNNLFEIKNIEIKNNFLIKEEEIKKKLQNIYKKNIFLVKERDLEKPVAEINFLEKIEVKKKYPNTIIIKVFETQPVAIVFKNKTKYLLDSSSKLITYEDSTDFDNLPNIFGKDGEKNFIFFWNLLKKNNFPIEGINNFYYFQLGRWDVQFLNNKIIKFPHNNKNESIVKAIELLNREDFKKYNIIDLRVSGKIIVE